MKKKTDLFEIDLARLDEEWVEQPSFFYEHAIKLADARKEFEMAKAELDLTKAEVDTKIRTHPERYMPGIKPTETSITGAVLQDPAFVAAQKEVIEKKHAMDVIQAVVTALDHRKSALERLVSLHGQNYFAVPKERDSASRELKSEISRRNARTKTKQ